MINEETATLEMDKVIEIKPMNPLQIMMRHRENTQKSRIRYALRLSAIERGVAVADVETVALLRQYHDDYLDMERGIDGQVKRAIRALPSNHVLHHMLCVKGVGPSFAAQFWAQVDITRAVGVRALYRYAGHGVKHRWEDGDAECPTCAAAQDEDINERQPKCASCNARWVGRAEKPVAGQTLAYNNKLKTIVYKIGDSMIESSGKRAETDNRLYADLYYEKRADYEDRDWGKSKLHRHLAARRYMQKIWMQHLWVTWRTLEGLSVSDPWPIQKLVEHKHYMPPEDFGWLALDDL